jgi:hypothetical protein
MFTSLIRLAVTVTRGLGEDRIPAIRHILELRTVVDDGPGCGVFPIGGSIMVMIVKLPSGRVVAAQIASEEEFEEARAEVREMAAFERHLLGLGFTFITG